MCPHRKAHHLMQPCYWHNVQLNVSTTYDFGGLNQECHAQTNSAIKTKSKSLRQTCRSKWKGPHCTDYLHHFILSFTFEENCCVSKQSFSFLVQTPDASGLPLTYKTKLCVSHRVSLFTLPVARDGFIRLIFSSC